MLRELGVHRRVRQGLRQVRSYPRHMACDGLYALSFRVIVSRRLIHPFGCHGDKIWFVRGSLRWRFLKLLMISLFRFLGSWRVGWLDGEEPEGGAMRQRRETFRKWGISV